MRAFVILGEYVVKKIQSKSGVTMVELVIVLSDNGHFSGNSNSNV